IFASSNWSSYKHHDGRPQKYYFIAFSGINAGIYSLQSVAEKALPPIGKYNILRCDSIADTVFHWERLCSARHSICDLSQRVKLDNAAALLALENHRKNWLHTDEEDDSDEINAPFESRARILTVVTSDAPLPNRRPPCPPVSPADSAAARKLGVAWKPSPAPKPKIKREDSVDHGTLRAKLEEPLGTIRVSRPRTKRNAHSRSPCVPSVSLWADGTPPRSSRMASLPSEAPAVSGAGTPSTPPLSTASRSRRTLSVHSDTSSVKFISRSLMDVEGADAMPGVEPPPLSPTITSASSLSSSTAFSISTASTTSASTPAQRSAAPAQSSATPAQRSVAPTARGGLDLMMVDEDDDQQGPCKLEKLQVFGSAREVKEAMAQVMQKQDFFTKKGKAKQIM
ncbi:hypothetical protein K438DRAFT_1861461, partial [Mycena galopus ATCC 62051]